MSRLDKAWADQVAEHPWRVILIVLLISTIMLWGAARLEMAEDLVSLLPEGTPAAEAFRTYLERFGGFEKVFVLITVTSDQETNLQNATDRHAPEDIAADLVFAAQKLRDELARSPEIAAARCGLEPHDEAFFFDFVLPRAALLLDDDWRSTVIPRLEPETIRRRALQLRGALSHPAGAFAARIARQDPLGFSDELPLAGLSALPLDPLTSTFLSADGQASLVIATPAGSELDAESGLRLLRDLERAYTSAQDDITTRLTFHALGGPLYAAHDRELLRSDLQWTVTTSAVASLLLLLAAFSGFLIPLATMAALAVGFLWTAGWMGVTVGALSAVSLGFAAVLVGLGVDYGIHGGTRFRQAWLAGSSPQEALRQTLATSGLPILISALTTAAAFTVLAQAHTRPLRQVGVLVAIGILSILLSTATVGATVLVQGTAGRLGKKRSTPLWHWLGAAARTTVDRAERNPWPVLGLSALLCLVSFWGCTRLTINPDLNALRPENHPLQAAEKMLHGHFDLGTETVNLILHAETLSTALDQADRIGEELRATLGKNIDWMSPADVLISPEAVRERLVELRQLPLARAADDLERELRAANLNPAAFSVGLAALRALAKGSDPGAPTKSARPSGLDELIHQDQDGVWLALRLRLPPGMWIQGPPPEVVARVAELAPEAAWASAGRLGTELRQQATQDLERLSLIALLAIAAVVFAACRRRPSRAPLALVPVSCGALWALGLWGILDRPLDLLSLSVLPILLGIGIDDGLHAVLGHEGARNNRPASVTATTREAGRAMALTTLTTAVGFLSLTLSHIPGLRHGGQLVAFGVFCCLFATLAVLPALEAAGRRLRTSRGVR